MSRIERPLYGRFKKRNRIFNKCICYGDDFNNHAEKTQYNATCKKNFTSKNYQVGIHSESEKLILNNRRILCRGDANIDDCEYFYNLMLIHNNYG